MYFVAKYQEFRRQQTEKDQKKKAEKELQSLNVKIDKLLAKLDGKQVEREDLPHYEGEECVICLVARANMQTLPCQHKVVCRKCFIKTIQSAVTQRCLPLRCVVCRTRVLKLRQDEPPLSPQPPPRVCTTSGPHQHSPRHGTKARKVHSACKTPPVEKTEEFKITVDVGQCPKHLKPIIRRPRHKQRSQSATREARRVTFQDGDRRNSTVDS